jgi:hypothetical protein
MIEADASRPPSEGGERKRDEVNEPDWKEKGLRE